MKNRAPKKRDKTKSRFRWWGGQDSNLRSHSQPIYSPSPLPLEHARHRRGTRRLLKVNRLVMPGLVQLGSPHLVQALMVRSAEAHRRSKPNVEVVEIFEGFDQPFGVDLRTSSFQRCD